MAPEPRCCLSPDRRRGEASYIVRTANGFVVSTTYFDDEPKRNFNLRKDEAPDRVGYQPPTRSVREIVRKGFMGGEVGGQDHRAVPPDHVIVNVIDDTWRTPAQIRIRLREPVGSGPLVDALERLADAGRIDRRLIDTKARKHGGGNYVLRQYRRCPGPTGISN